MERAVEDVVVADHDGGGRRRPLARGERDDPLLGPGHEVGDVAPHREEGVEEERQLREAGGVLGRGHEAGLGDRGRPLAPGGPERGGVAAPQGPLVEDHLLDAGEERDAARQDGAAGLDRVHEGGLASREGEAEGGRHPRGASVEDPLDERRGEGVRRLELVQRPGRARPRGTGRTLSSALHGLRSDQPGGQHRLPPADEVGDLVPGRLEPLEGQGDRIHVVGREAVGAERLEALLQPGGHEQDAGPGPRGRRLRDHAQDEPQGQRAQAEPPGRGAHAATRQPEIGDEAGRGGEHPGEAPGPPDAGAAVQGLEVVDEHAQPPPAEAQGLGQDESEDLPHQPAGRARQGQRSVERQPARDAHPQEDPEGGDQPHHRQEPREQVAHPPEPADQAQGRDEPEGSIGARPGGRSRHGPGGEGREPKHADPVRGQQSRLGQQRQGPRGPSEQGPARGSQGREPRGRRARAGGGGASGGHRGHEDPPEDPRRQILCAEASARGGRAHHRPDRWVTIVGRDPAGRTARMGRSLANCARLPAPASPPPVPTAPHGPPP